jgi:hypothetical protein
MPNQVPPITSTTEDSLIALIAKVRALIATGLHLETEQVNVITLDFAIPRDRFDLLAQECPGFYDPDYFDLSAPAIVAKSDETKGKHRSMWDLTIAPLE